jgi:hypothetical protein
MSHGSVRKNWLLARSEGKAFAQRAVKVPACSGDIGSILRQEREMEKEKEK